MSDPHRELADGLARLDERYVAAIRAFAPPNPQFERDRIIASLANKREIAYVCGFLSEGENETALILSLVRDLLAADPQAETGHLLDEAWYYLRTSIDESWQLDTAAPSAIAAIRYLEAMLGRRIERALAAGERSALAEPPDADARELLEAFRS
jgi:hypothetical protein